ncbi:hypothetical protein BC828DRAFT_410031, partial [Blastocladiella britannica]
TKATNAAIKKCDQTTHGISAGFNPFLALPRLDLHRDTVTDNLHVGPLGHNKYLWEYTTLLKLGLVKNADAVTAFMRTMDRSSHKVFPTAGAITRHYRSMAGSEFKTLAQIMPFLLESVIPTASPARAAKDVDGIESHQERRQLLIDLALDTAILNKLLYQSSIADKEDYRQRVDKVSRSLFRRLRLCKLLWDKKGRRSFKVHQLLHLASHVLRHGGFVDKSCEVFEATNGPVREAIISTNRINPSRDVARVMAYKLGAGYVGSGGYWLDANNEVRQAGPEVLRVFQEPAVRKFFGISDEVDNKPRRLYSAAPAEVAGPTGDDFYDGFFSVLAAAGIDSREDFDAHSVAEFGRVWPAKRSEGCPVGGNVIFRRSDDGPLHRGKIARLLRLTNKAGSVHEFAVVQVYARQPHLEPFLRCPRIALTNELALVSVSKVEQAFQVMHACGGDCSDGEHLDDGHIVINVHRITDPEFPAT